jgi:hypothetical protein
MYSPKHLTVEYSLGCVEYLPDAESVMVAVRDEIDRQIPKSTFDQLRFDRVSLFVQIISETELYPRVFRRTGGCARASVKVAGRCIQAMTAVERPVALCYALTVAITLLVRGECGCTERLEAITERYARLPNGDATLMRLGVSPEPELGPVTDEECDEDAFIPPTEITIEYPIQGWGTPEDLQKRSELHSALDRALRQAAIGAVTGGEFGGGSVSIFCASDDPEYALKAIRDALSTAGLSDGATILVGE